MPPAGTLTLTDVEPGLLGGADDDGDDGLGEVEGLGDGEGQGLMSLVFTATAVYGALTYTMVPLAALQGTGDGSGEPAGAVTCTLAPGACTETPVPLEEGVTATFA